MVKAGEVEKLSDLKSGDYIWRLHERENPQIGCYFNLSLVKVNEVLESSIVCEDGEYSLLSGERVHGNKSVYGSSYYKIMNYEQAHETELEYINNGFKNRGEKITKQLNN